MIFVLSFFVMLFIVAAMAVGAMAGREPERMSCLRKQCGYIGRCYQSADLKRRCPRQVWRQLWRSCAYTRALFGSGTDRFTMTPMAAICG